MSDKHANLPDRSARTQELMQEPAFAEFNARLGPTVMAINGALQFSLGNTPTAIHAEGQLYSTDDYSFDMIFEAEGTEIVIMALSLVEMPTAGRGSLNSLIKLPNDDAVIQNFARFTPSTKAFERAMACLPAIAFALRPLGYEVYRTADIGEISDLIMIDRKGKVGLVYIALRAAGDEPQEPAIDPNATRH